MDIRLRSEEKIRLIGDGGIGDNFIDLQQVGYDALAIDLFPLFHYIEIREKENQMRVFTFKKKSDKKHYDFGWWSDADVTFSVNKQIMNK